MPVWQHGFIVESVMVFCAFAFAVHYCTFIGF
jgi:hypothetical protein